MANTHGKCQFPGDHSNVVTTPIGGSDGKERACSAGDLGSIPGSGISPGEGNGYSLQYSCLENPTDRGAWWATVHGITERVGHDWARTHAKFPRGLSARFLEFPVSPSRWKWKKQCWPADLAGALQWTLGITQHLSVKYTKGKFRLLSKANPVERHMFVYMSTPLPPVGSCILIQSTFLLSYVVSLI